MSGKRAFEEKLRAVDALRETGDRRALESLTQWSAARLRPRVWLKSIRADEPSALHQKWFEAVVSTLPPPLNTHGDMLRLRQNKLLHLHPRCLDERMG